MNQTKKQNKKNNLIRIILILFSLISFFEINIVRKIFTFNVGVYVLPIVWVMVILIVILFIYLKIKGLTFLKAPKYIKNIIITTIILIIISVAKILLMNDVMTGFVHMAYFYLPIVYALILSFILINEDKDNNKTILTFIYFFSVYVVLNIIINISVYDYSFFDINSSDSDRLISPGGGPVIFGYSIALVYALLFFIRRTISIRKYIIIATILIIGSFFTKSRGSMWVVVVITFVSMITNKNMKMNVIIFSIAVVLVPILYLLIQEYVPRFFIFGDNSRANTLTNSLQIFLNYNAGEILTGKGLGQLFQYNQYAESRSWGWVPNVFIYQGYQLLVQPHNTWLYILMEMGILGTIILLFLIFAIPLYKNDRKYKIELFIFIATFIFLNMFDSILMIEPGSAAMWWFILIMVVTSFEVKKEKINENILEKANDGIPNKIKNNYDMSVSQ